MPHSFPAAGFHWPQGLRTMPMRSLHVAYTVPRPPHPSNTQNPMADHTHHAHVLPESIVRTQFLGQPIANNTQNLMANNMHHALVLPARFVHTVPGPPYCQRHPVRRHVWCALGLQAHPSAAPAWHAHCQHRCQRYLRCSGHLWCYSD